MKKGAVMAWVLLAIIIVGVFLYFFSGRDNSQSSVMKTVSLYYQDTKNPDFNFDCSLVGATARTIPIPEGKNIIDETVRALFDGPTANEKALGFVSPFEPSVSIGSTRPLGDYFNSTKLDGKTLIVDFRHGSLSYLNAPACAQIAVKSAISATLKQFTEIEFVEYSIDGVIFTEWDA